MDLGGIRSYGQALSVPHRPIVTGGCPSHRSQLMASTEKLLGHLGQLAVIHNKTHLGASTYKEIPKSRGLYRREWARRAVILPVVDVASPAVLVGNPRSERGPHLIQVRRLGRMAGPSPPEIFAPRGRKSQRHLDGVEDFPQSLRPRSS